MIAGLPMYERPETAAAHDAFWTLIRDACALRDIPAPTQLSRGIEPWELWLDPGLLLAQTCGLPYRARLHRHVALVGTPDYGLPDVPPGHYRSAIVVRSGDPRETLADFAGATLAFNDPLSQSGWAAIAGTGVDFSTKLPTGSHAASARSVASGEADLAALDAVTWRDLQRFEPGLADALRVLTHTAPTPGLPYITAAGNDAGKIADAVVAAIAGLGLSESDTLGIRALVRIPASDYLALPVPPPP